MSKFVDLDEQTVIQPKLIRFGDTVYRRLDVAADGIVDDYTLKRDPRQQNFLLPRKFLDKDDGRKQQQQYSIDELEAEDFQEEDQQGQPAPPTSAKPKCDDVRLDDDSTEPNWELTLQEGEELKSVGLGGNRSGFSLKLRICPVFYPFIIGKRGITKANIESDSRTRITVPRENDNLRSGGGGGGGSFISIIGPDKRSLAIAKRRIDLLVESFRGKQRLTHFVAIPIGSTNEDVRSRFLAFKAAVLGDVKCSLSKGITEAAFQSAARLHLTLRALYLGDAFERTQATRILQSLKTEVIDGLMKSKKKVVLRMKGIDYMNDDPSEVQVLFAKVEEAEESGGLFKEIVNKTFDYFTPLGKGSFGRENCEWKVKIHATLLNTSFIEEREEKEGQPQQQQQQQPSKEAESDSKMKKGGGGGGGRPPPPKRLTMDVRAIVDKFADYDFGTFTFDQLHICTVGSSARDEYYATLAEITF